MDVGHENNSPDIEQYVPPSSNRGYEKTLAKRAQSYTSRVYDPSQNW